MTNPLLAVDGLPLDFRAIDPASIAPTIDSLLKHAYDALATAASPATPARFDALSLVLDTHVERLSFAWNVVAHLQSVADTPALRAAYQDCLPRVSAFHAALGSDPGLYRKYRAIADEPGLSPQRARAVSLALQSARLSGAELEGEERQCFNAISERCAVLSQRFSNNVLDATDRYACHVDERELDGVPADVFQAARQAARDEGREGCKLGLQAPVYLALMRHASNRCLREKLYHAYTTRASEFGHPELDNSGVMRELLALRQEQARLLGMDNYAELSLAPKMAHRPDQVTGFLYGLAVEAHEAAARELVQLSAFAERELRLDALEAWDLPFAMERARQAGFAFSQDEVKRYFTVERVLAGLFTLVQELFDVAIEHTDLPTWHDSVRAYRVSRAGEELGIFYVDLYARAGKRGGAWVNGLQSRWRQGARLRTALSCVVCNFSPPGADGVATLGHEELVTLFHEFGHNLHFLLSAVDELGVSGFAGVEWDAIELPSQLMENLAWEWDVVEGMSAHVDDGSKLPRALFDKMLAAKSFQGGLALLRQIEFSLFDMKLHAGQGAPGDIQALLNEVRREIAPMAVPAYNRFAHCFTHIFAGGYAAGYYSYLWAEVLAADAWSAFEEAGVLDAASWRRFRREVLETGGSRPAADNFVAFRGRAPDHRALLRQRGIHAADTVPA